MDPNENVPEGATLSEEDKLKDMDAANQFDCIMKYGVLPRTHTVYYPTAPDTEQGKESSEGEVNTGTTRLFIKGMLFLQSFARPGTKITVVMNCYGGDEYQGIAVHNAIQTARKAGYPVEIFAMGAVMSMGVYILQAAETGYRVLSPGTRLMIHEGTWGFGEDHASNVERTNREGMLMKRIYTDVIWRRVQEKHPKYSRKKFAAKMRFDWYMSAEEAVRMGLADRIA